MDEFKRLPWPLSDVGANLEEPYRLNVSEYQKTNPTDVFFCHLMEIDPLHYTHIQQESKEPNETECQTSAVKQFIDPRTGVEIPSHECNHQTVNLESRNIFMKNFIQISKLQKHEHSACLSALHHLKKNPTALSMDEKANLLLYESTSALRLEEKCEFLNKLREHFLAKLSNRFHDIPPSIEHFVVQNWKRRLIEMHRRMTNVKYQIRTAMSLQSAECTVECDLIEQEHLGIVPKMNIESTGYLRQSCQNLNEAYNVRKNTCLKPLIEEQLTELCDQHAIDFIAPISIIKCILGSRKGWCCLMSIQESEQSTMFNPKKKIVFNKPLPPTSLSGNERYKKGAKYLIRSCFNRNSSHVFSHSDCSEQKISDDTESNECYAVPNLDIEYKIEKFDEFTKQHQKVAASKENMSFNIFNLTGRNNIDEYNETLRLLVPTKLDAYKTNDNGEVQLVNYSAKIEFQSEYGAEKMTKDELIREWCELYFRPKTITERIRFDWQTGKILQHQSISLSDVEDELKSQQHGIETQELLQRLWHTFQTFVGFPDGEYLLKNDAKQSGHIKIYEKTENSTESVSIAKIFENISFAMNIFDPVDWQPIDDQILTEIHEKHQILPCAFPHSEYLTSHHVKPPREEYTKTLKMANKSKKVQKINPIDDSNGVLQMARAKKTKQHKRISIHKILKKNLKRRRNHAKRKEKRDAQKAEVDGLEMAKQFVASTMDQYQPINKQAQIHPIGTRTRTRSQCMDSQRNEPHQSDMWRSPRISHR